MKASLIKVFFTQGMICLHKSNRGGLDCILGDPRANHRSHTKPDFHEQWDVGILMLVYWSKSVTQKTWQLWRIWSDKNQIRIGTDKQNSTIPITEVESPNKWFSFLKSMQWLFVFFWYFLRKYKLSHYWLWHSSDMKRPRVPKNSPKIGGCLKRS